MRLYHVSEEAGIAEFVPRPSEQVRGDSVVWAVAERCLPNFLVPRDCPRVTFHVADKTLLADRQRWLGSEGKPHVVAVESAWLARIRSTTLYLYEFDPVDFRLHDATAGYYVSHSTVRPIAAISIANLPAELKRHGAELRVLDNLWPLCAAIQTTSFNWSMIRIRNAAPPPEMTHK